MNEDKIMEMLAQVLQGQTELKQEIQGVKEIQLRMENKFDDKISGLFDFVDYQRNINKDTGETLARIEAKIEVLQLETAHIRRVK